MIEWCEDLDYDKYINNWNKLATSAYNEEKLDFYDELEEELFLKNNDEYETRLKEHLYLFEEKKL